MNRGEEAGDTRDNQLRDTDSENVQTSKQELVVRSVLAGVLLKSLVSALAGLFRSNAAEHRDARQALIAADINDDSNGFRAPHQSWGTLLVICCFVVALGAGGVFLASYWSFDKVHWNAGYTYLLGGSLAVFAGGLGAGLVLHAHWLMRDRQVTEPREVLPSSPEQREATLEVFSAEHDVDRRSLLVGLAVTSLGVFAAIFVSMMRSMAPPPGPTIFSTVWKRGQRLVTVDGKPTSVHTLQPGSTVVVFPEDKIGDEHAQTVLIRVDETALRLPEVRAQWAPMGYVAYSRVCTHAGCPVGIFETTTNLLLCPCHQSTFDVLRGAQPTGGPAARPLPQLPLYVDKDGTLYAGGGFSEPPGPGYWGLA